jgi:hypothetical protein
MWGQAILYVLVPLALTLSSGVLIVVGGATLAYPGGYPDPFATYEAVMPGRRVVALEEPPCDFQIIPGQILLMECDSFPATDHFVSIHAITQDGRFTAAWFYARNLVIADVITHWGQPDSVIHDENKFILRWDNGLRLVIHPVDPAGRFSYGLPVDWLQVYFEPTVQ